MQIDTAFQKFTNECRHGFTIRRREPLTIRNYTLSMRLLLRWFQLTDTHQINSIIMRRFMTKGKKERHWSDTTLINNIKNLRPFFNWCVKEGLLKDHPLEGIVLPEKRYRIPQIYTEAELQKILHAIDVSSDLFVRYRDKAIIATLQMTGIRRGELLGLQVSDIDFDNSLIRIRGQTSKTRKDRVVMMTEKLMVIMRVYVDVRASLEMKAPHLWLSKKTRARFDGWGLKKRFLDISKLSGVRVRAHKFRHTFATETYCATKDIVGIKQILGHKDIATTMIYTQVKPEDTKLTMELNPMNDLF